MAIVGELINILGYKLEGEENLKKFNKGMGDAEVKAESSAKSINKIGAAAGAAATAAIAIGTKSVQNFAAFERQMTRIGVTAGVTGTNLKTVSDDIQRMAFDLALPLQEAVNALDTLVASGLELDQAMAFLPSVLATAQAAGAATNDIANTAIKTASALGLEADQMQRAFDIMVTGGKAGQFELKDMARYIPELANSFASLGYSGEEGLKRLIAVMQTLREDTGSAGAAATNAQNIFGKMFAEDTAKRFAEFGIDLREEMEAAAKAGEDAVSAFTRLSNEAIKGDLTQLPLLFRDQQFRLGMQSLMTSTDSMEKFLSVLNSGEVDGSVFRDLNTVLDDTQAKLDRMSGSFDRFWKALGSNLAGPVGGVLDAATGYLSFEEALTSGLTKRGLTEREQATWRARNWFSGEERARAAREGGYASTAEERTLQKTMPDAYRVLGRRPQRPVSRTPDPTLPLTSVAEDLGFGAATSVMNDNKQDNRSYNTSVSAPVTVNVQQATQAPGAVGGAVSAAIGQAAAAQQSRIESEPAQP